MIGPLTYTESLESVVDADLDGFLAQWDFEPPAGTLLRMLQGSSVVILARDARSSRICGYVPALTDRVVCGYVAALEVRRVSAMTKRRIPVAERA